MAKLSDWASNAATFAVELESSLVPKFYVSKLPPSSADLTGVAAKEAADGWPTAVIDRNNARRVAKYDFFVAEHGFTIGDNPLEDVAPSLSSSLYGIRPPKRFRSPSREGGVVKDFQRARDIGERWFKDQSTCIAFIRSYLLPDASDLTAGPVVYWDNVTYMDETAFIQALDAHAQSDTDDQYLHVGFHIWVTPDKLSTSPAEATGGGCASIIVRFLKQSSWKGVRALMYGPIYRAASWAHCNMPDKSDWELCRVWGDVGLDRYIRLARPGMTVKTVVGSSAYASSQLNSNLLWGTVEYVPCGANPTDAVTWWEQRRSLFEKRHNMWSAEVYAIGNPEFVNRFSAWGAWDGRKLKGPKLCFDWDGQRLVDMSPTMKESDKAAVSKLFISTLIDDHADPVGAISLDDLYVEQLYKQNELSVADEVYKAAIVHEGETLPAMSFKEALENARTADTKIWHRQSVSEVDAFEVDSVSISGTSDAVSVTCRNGNVIVSNDVSFGLMCYLHGAHLDTVDWLGGLEPDPVKAAWGISSSTLASESDKVRIRKEFDEATCYGRGAPALSKCSRGSRTAMIMAQCATSRKQFSSFVVGAAVMAANARRILI